MDTGTCPVVRVDTGIFALHTMIIAVLLCTGCCRMSAPASVDEAVDTYGRRGREAYDEGRYVRAAAAWEKGLEAARKGGRSAETARFLVDLSRTSEGLGRYEKALAQAEQALEILEYGGDLQVQCMALMQKGLAYRRKGRYADARPIFDRALELSRRLNNPDLESESLRHIGALLQDQGQLDMALSYYRQAMELARAHGDDMNVARCLNNMGLLFDAKAKYPEALARHQASLVLRKKIGDRAGEGKVLGNICITYSHLNQMDLALRHCEAALDIAQEIGDRQRAANHLNNIGSLYRRLDRPDKALRYYRRSFQIKRELFDPAGEARALNNIGETYRHLGKLDAAEDYLERSLAIKKRIGDAAGQSAVYQNLALIYIRRGRFQDARSCYMKALFLNQRTGLPELTWRAYDGLSYVYEALSMDELAILYGKQALRSIQKTRADLLVLEKPLRLSYLEDKERVYRHVADLLIRKGRLPEAQQVVLLLKEEEYRHYLDTRGMDDASVENVETTIEERHWLKEIAAFGGKLGSIGREIEWLETERRRRALTGAERERLLALFDTADEVHEAFKAYLQEIEAAYTKQAGESAIEFGRKDLDSLASLQGKLGEFKLRTVIATFLVLKDNISIILTTPAIQIPYRIEIPEEDLNRLVFDFKQTLINPGRDPRPQAKALYDLLIAPMAQDLIDLGVETLMISLDGTLRYLPFAAFFDGKQYLTEHFTLALFTPAAKTLFGESGTRELRIAGLGMSEEIVGFSRLPAVAEELDGIVKEDDKNDIRGILPGKVFLNRDFTAAGLSDMLGKGYPLIHLASHFAFKPGTAEDSFILLGDGSRLTLSDLESRRYPFKFIDLLTLSACDTAVSGKNAQGREIESFATMAQKRGAKAILASLWPVADACTGTFMALFYRLRSEQRLSKAEALRKVQLMFLSGTDNANKHEQKRRGVAVVEGEGGFTPPPGAPYAHPFYWAPFILMGNYL